LTDALIETDRAIDGVRNAVGELRVRGGREIPMGVTSASSDRRTFTILEPIGLVAAISAFNHPLNLIVHQVVPAIAVGGSAAERHSVGRVDRIDKDASAPTLERRAPPKRQVLRRKSAVTTP
jgi:acyl-CoA reductase-like NAD-dependent aldehyde dehydrogenase